MTAVPRALRTAFVVHAAVDLAFALPLFVAPERTLALFGWTTVDPVATRLVAAALLGIGGESWLCRDDGVERYRTMLRLKIVWSLAAIAGLAWGVATGEPPMTRAILLIFLVFSALWLWWWNRLRAPTGR